MNISTIGEIARQELVITVRNRWTLIFATVFAVLVISIAYFGMIAEGFSGMQSFTRTSASLLNLVLYIIPLVALTMGTLSFTGDKGSTELLFAQPLSRMDVVMGKLLGVFASIALSTLMGFSLAGVIIIFSSGVEGFVSYALFVILSLALAFVFLSIALLVATASGRKAKAFGVALFLWFFFVLLYDLLALGVTLLLHGQTANTFLFMSLFGNPVDMVRVSTLILLDNATIFGAAGAALTRFLGGAAPGVAVLAAALSAWIILPLVIAGRVIRGQDI